MKNSILLLISVLLYACSNGQIINPLFSPIDEATIGVKSKIVYPSIESNKISSIEDFEYNNDGQLIKKLYYGGDREMLYHYELFKYDSKGELIIKLNFHSNINSPTGFILLDSTSYLYSGNLLVAEKITYPLANYFDQYKYEYDEKYLIKKSKYHNTELEFYITYEYKDGKLYKERFNDITEFKEYKYNGDQLIEIVFYTSKNEAIRKINYSYNGKGKLDLEKVDELFTYSSSKSHIIKYVY